MKEQSNSQNTNNNPINKSTATPVTMNKTLFKGKHTILNKFFLKSKWKFPYNYYQNYSLKYRQFEFYNEISWILKYFPISSSYSIQLSDLNYNNNCDCRKSK